MHRTTESSPEAGGQQSNVTSIVLAAEGEISSVLSLPGSNCLLVQTLPGSLDRLRGPAPGRVRLRSPRLRVEPAAGGAMSLQKDQRGQGRRLARRPEMAGARGMVQRTGATIPPRTTVD